MRDVPCGDVQTRTSVKAGGLLVIVCSCPIQKVTGETEATRGRQEAACVNRLPAAACLVSPRRHTGRGSGSFSLAALNRHDKWPEGRNRLHVAKCSAGERTQLSDVWAESKPRGRSQWEH